MYLNNHFVLKLPTIDNITKHVKLLGKGCMIYRIDIKRAFRHVKLDPKDYDLLGLHQDNWFRDTCRSCADTSFDALSALLAHLGFVISKNKLVKPSTCVNCLGILVKTKDFTLSIPPQKMQEILQMCQTWRCKIHCSKHQLQSLLGSLLFVSKCVRTPRFFLNRLLEELRNMHEL